MKVMKLNFEDPKELTVTFFAVIDSMAELIEEEVGEDAGEYFKTEFYKAADKRLFFDKRTPEERLKDNLIESGLSEEDADVMVKFAVSIRNIMEKHKEGSDDKAKCVED